MTDLTEQDPNEQANISGADLAIMVDEMKLLRKEVAGCQLLKNIAAEYGLSVFPDIEELQEQLAASQAREKVLLDEIKFAKDVVATQRYGVAWEGDPKTPTHKQMDDGYWMPWHVVDLLLAGFLADIQTDDTALKQLLAAERELCYSVHPVAWRWSESDGERWFDWTTDWTHHDRAVSLGCKTEYAHAIRALGD